MARDGKDGVLSGLPEPPTGIKELGDGGPKLKRIRGQLDELWPCHVVEKHPHAGGRLKTANSDLLLRHEHVHATSE